MLSLLLVISLNVGVILGFTYYPGPLSYAAAKQRCRDEGSILATIINDATRLEALEAINDRDAPWIGLEHTTDANGKCFFYYPEENDLSICPEDNYKCIAFWVNYKPILINEGGFECTAYYPEEHHLNGAINNDVSCTTERPFLCSESAQICDTEDFVCGDGGSYQKCADGEGIDGMHCLCDIDAVGISVCSSDFVCGTLPLCNPDNGHSDCAADEVCIDEGCCGEGTVCIPLCGEDATLRRLMDGHRRLMDETKPPCSKSYCPHQ